MINDILDFSQISNGKLSLHPQNFNLMKLIKETKKLIKFQAKKKGLNLILESNINEDTVIFNDPNRLKQVLFNLLGNSLKFTLKGHIKVSVFEKISGFESTGDSPIMISVEDTGIGIKKEDLSQLFSRFGKINFKGCDKINPSGAGLGLSISQGLVRELNENRLDAEIRVESEYGVGTKFSFPLYSQGNLEEQQKMEENKGKLENKIPSSRKFPLQEDSTHDIPLIQSITPKNKRILDKKISVLIVDDDQINILVASRNFEAIQGFLITTAFDGQEAINLVTNHASKGQFFDIILMDCNMPIMDGFEATQKIQQLIAESVLRPLPIIGVSANSAIADIKKCFDCGMTDYLIKPYKREELKHKINLHLKITI